MTEPRIVVFSSLFPNALQPSAGLFIRERMFRVGQQLPLIVVSPKPWFPGQGLVRRFRPHYRPMPPHQESQSGFNVLFPRFLAIPGLFRSLDSLFMALASYLTLRRLRARGYNLIDAHFAYPDGHAATRLGRWLGLPVCVTLRGTEVPQSLNPTLAAKLREVFGAADKVITVSDSLRRLALSLGLPSERGQVVGNGVDAERFIPMPKAAARERFALPVGAKVLITVGGLVERKGFHRVIACLPTLMKRHRDLHYLVVGGPCPEGDMSLALKQQVAELGLAERVHFLGPTAPDDLKWPLSAADVFVLSTRNEGWANVILEAMACGLPVIATDVGGNREVVCRPELGAIVPFGDQAGLTQALDQALTGTWDKYAIRAYAEENSWDNRVEVLIDVFSRAVNHPGSRGVP
jgi:teichuronic acid biosynthesis glycosyltransferase TuaC